MTDKEIRLLAEERFGNHPHVFGGQRDGFTEGFKKAMELVKNNAVLPLVIWRNWLLPFIICLFIAVFFRVLFHYLPKNIVTTDFLAGWFSCMSWYIARKYYAI